MRLLNLILPGVALVATAFALIFFNDFREDCLTLSKTFSSDAIQSNKRILSSNPVQEHRIRGRFAVTKMRYLLDDGAYYESRDLTLSQGESLVLMNHGGFIISTNDLSILKRRIVIWVSVFLLGISSVIVLCIRIKKHPKSSAQR